MRIAGTPPDLDAAIDDPVGDDLLRLVFIACHPVLSTDARVALTLRLLGGLTTPEIARAFLVGESAMEQRITRAKARVAGAGVPFEAPDAVERLPSVVKSGSVLAFDPAALDGAGAYSRLPAYTTADGYLQIRVIDVRAFIRWEDILGNIEDLPGRIQRGPRLFYGVKWNLWN